MFFRRKDDRCVYWYPDPEDMLDVVCRPRWIAVPPLRENLIHIAQAPIDQAAGIRRVYTRFLAQFARRRCGQRLPRFLASGYGLPVIGEIGAFEQQYLQVKVINDDQGRDRNFVTR